MKIFSDLRNTIGFERLHLPFIESLEDRSIAAHIGYFELVRETPLTLKRLYLLGIGSIATVQRRLARLVAMGIVVKRRQATDRRAFALHLAANTKRDYNLFATALASKTGIGDVDATRRAGKTR